MTYNKLTRATTFFWVKGFNEDSLSVSEVPAVFGWVTLSWYIVFRG